MSEDKIEQEIQEKQLNAPRLTPQDIDAAIIDESFTVLPSGKSMVCELTLVNGFTVRGESACVSKANFDEDIGRDVARANARSKVWELEGYRLQQMVYCGGEFVAKAAHEVNRAYCQAMGDNGQPSWEEAPDWQKDSARLGVLFHQRNKDAGPEASHESWMEQKEADGWVYGKKKDAEAKTHPCMVPFKKLPVEQKAKDYIFKAVVETLS